MYSILNEINSPENLKKLDKTKLITLAEEIRRFLIEKVSKTGGHLASNLGVVELTIALHRSFATPEDKIIWDVGHQAYVHKILTGRMFDFDTLRQFGGISGFPKTKESEYDCFNTGHSSTSISAALGIARARDIKKENYSVVAIIGDGALSGGMAFEALNDAGHLKNDITVILNDNQMSISDNVGGMSKYLSKIRTKPSYFKFRGRVENFVDKIPFIGKKIRRGISRIKGSIKYLIMPRMIFEEIGFKYIGPIDGHNIEEMEKVFKASKLMKGPIFIHVCTQKGKGYQYAEEKPDLFHGIPPFEIETGEALGKDDCSFSNAFGKKLIEIANKDDKVIAITASMTQGTGLQKFAEKFPERFFDVGIAEQHAVTFAAGMAINGLKPVLAIYSSFLQRAYDQILHDVAMQNLDVVFAIDRAGIVGRDGETHQGIYDISFLNHIPNISIIAPSDFDELGDMLEYAVFEHKGPIAIRYPKGGTACVVQAKKEKIKYGQGILLKKGKDVTIVGVGDMVETAMEVSENLKKYGIDAEIINARFIKPIDDKLIIESVKKTGNIVTIENNTLIGGFCSSLTELINCNCLQVKHKIFAYPDEFILQGSQKEILNKYNLDAESITNAIKDFLIGKDK